MVRPKMFAIKRERARFERNLGEVFHVRVILERIEARDAPLLRFAGHIFVFAAANDVKDSINKRVPANFRADVDRAPNSSGIFDLMHISRVPLTEIEMLAVEAQVRPSEVGAGE